VRSKAGCDSGSRSVSSSGSHASGSDAG
jgi:hypothetical protein